LFGEESGVEGAGYEELFAEVVEGFGGWWWGLGVG